MARTISELFTIKTAVGFFNQVLDVAVSVGLITTTWRVGDPTLTQFTALSRMLAAGEQQRVDFAKAGFLADATGDWLKLRALDVYGVTAVEALPATSTLLLTNGGGGFYNRLAGSAVFKSSLSGKTYRSTTDFVLNGLGATATVSVVAEEAGSGSSAAVNEIDSIVTTMLGVVVTSSTVAVGVDEETEASIRSRCLATLGALSPNGPADAYRYVALNPALTGTTLPTRAAVRADNTNGTVTIWVATASGTASGGVVAAVQTAIERWATPLCITPTVVSASVVTVNVTASIHGSALPADATARINAALATLFAGLPIASTVGGYSLDPTTITTAIRNAVPQIETLPAYTPVGVTNIPQGSVPVLGTVGITVV